MLPLLLCVIHIIKVDISFILNNRSTELEYHTQNVIDIFLLPQKISEKSINDA